MHTVDFLRRVLPHTGSYCVVTIGKRTTHKFVDTVDKLASTSLQKDAEGHNTYYAISAFIEPGNRKQANVRATKVLALDVDCGPEKPFPDAKAGLQALGKFLAVTKLPMPMVVHSGRGLHCYWPLSRELAPPEWKPLAEGLKKATIQNDFAVDAGCTANSALILRPINTHNPKNNKLVRLLKDAPDYTPEELTQILQQYIAASGNLHRIPKSATGSRLLESLAVKQDFPPAKAENIVEKCLQVRWSAENQDRVPEPQWYNLIGVAAYCEEPEQTAIKWSQNHPGYSEQETLRKLEHWRSSTTGPTTCNKFESERPQGCKGCPYYNKIGTPARLGVVYQERDVAADAVHSIASQVMLPRPYKRTDVGIVVSIDGQDTEICPFDIYPVSYGLDESLGYEVVRFYWKRPHKGWQELILRQALLVSGNSEFPTAIADQGIVLSSKLKTENFQHMLRSYMDSLRQQQGMTNIYGSMGWKADDTEFVLGSRIFKREQDGSVREEDISYAAQSSRLGSELYTSRGSLREWVSGTQIIDTARLYTHGFALLVGMSAPLYHFTGLKGLTISLYGPSGGGKTLAQYWQQSIWGNPEQLHFSAKATQNAIFNRLGTIAHLPMTIDEVTTMDVKEAGNFVYWVSEGKDKARLNQKAEERDQKTWACPTTVSTNRSLNSMLIASRMETDAQMARVLEISIPTRKIFSGSSTAGKKIYHFLMMHHGLVGQEIIRRLVGLGPDVVRQIIAEASDTFMERYKVRFAGPERFWEQALVLADVMGRLGTDWGLIAFDYVACIEWVLAQLGAIRRTINDQQEDCFDVLSNYLNDRADAAVTILNTKGGAEPLFDYTRTPRGTVNVRYELFRESATDDFTNGVVMLNLKDFRRWLAENGCDYNTIVSDIKKSGAIQPVYDRNGDEVAYPRKYLGKNTPIKSGQVQVLHISLKHDRMQGILHDKGQSVEEILAPQLRVVGGNNESP